MARTAWYRLDNVGKFYSAEAGRHAQTVFRFAAEMEDEVAPELLQQALDATVALFPGFNVSLRSGLFWHYLEPSSQRPRVQQEALPICFGLHAGPKSILFRVSYHVRRINLEVSHMISDGRGTLGFFRELIGQYTHLRYDTPALPCSEDVLLASNEDSFSKHFARDKAASTPTQRAYRLSGIRDRSDPTYLEYHLSAREVHEHASALGVSVTSLIIAAVICALCDGRPASAANQPIRLTVPVDLRRFFGSDTMRNFFGLATVTYHEAHCEPIGYVATLVQEQLKNAARREQLEKRMNQMIALERNLLLRAAPLFLKDLVLGLATRIANRDITTAVSSLGRISFSDEVDAHVRSVNLQTSTADLNFLVCTFGDDLSIGIATLFTDMRTVRAFCRIFSDMGIHGFLNINKDAAGVARSLRSAQLQETVEHLRQLREKEIPHDGLR